MRIDVCGESLVLCPERAAFWPARASLLVADAHFGKAASFRARGVPVPEGTTASNLATFDRLIAAHNARRIVFLGDFRHSRESHARATLGSLATWCVRHPDLELVLILGNHDAHAGRSPPTLGIECVAEPLIDCPFALCHHAEPYPGAYVLAGHLHPTYRLSGRHDSLRLPGTRVGPQVAVLPAFGDFTGGHTIQPRAADRVYVTDGARVLAIPQLRAA